MHESEYQKIFELEANHWWFETRRRLVRQMLERYLPDRRSRILDLGCGTAHQLRFLEKLGYTRSCGIDISALAIDFCVRLGLSNVRLEDATAILSHDGHFDALLAFDLLEQLPDDAAALREFARVLRPGGLVILTVPAFGMLWSHHDVVLQHYRRYRFRDFDALAEESNFSIETWSYFFCAVFPLVVAIRWLRRALGPRQTSDLGATPEPINAALKVLGALEVAFLLRESISPSAHLSWWSSASGDSLTPIRAGGVQAAWLLHFPRSFG